MKTLVFGTLMLINFQITFGQPAISVDKQGEGTALIFLPGYVA